MLARHAENMFWAGRNLERADDTARMLDVAFHAAIQVNNLDAADVSRRLLQVLRLETSFDELYDHVGPETVATFLLAHPENPGSVAASLRAGRENLRTTRELVSSEMWESVNRAYLDISTRSQRYVSTPNPPSPYRLIGAVRDHCQTVAGVATQTMPRDDAWNFLNLGYMIERAVMTLRLISARNRVDQDSFEEWISALRSTSSLEAFQRAARGSASARDVAGFLFFNETHPRSVLYCLSRSEEYLERLGGPNTRGRARRMLGRLRSELDFSDLDDLLDDGLVEFCTQMENGVRAVADAVAEEYFRRQSTAVLGAVTVPPIYIPSYRPPGSDHLADGGSDT